MMINKNEYDPIKRNYITTLQTPFHWRCQLISSPHIHLLQRGDEADSLLKNFPRGADQVPLLAPFLNTLRVFQN